MSGTPATTAEPIQADPPQDRSGQPVPGNIRIFLHVIRVLLGYGRHLAGTVPQRATAANFTSIAARFGTHSVDTILAHIQRGILRAIALQRVLLKRAATGRDVAVVMPNYYVAVPDEPPADPPAAPPAEPAAAAMAIDAATAMAAVPDTHQAPARQPRQPGRDDPAAYMPSLKELEAQVRRRPLGQTLIDICFDFGIIQDFCSSEFWDQLFHLMYCCHGNFDAMWRERRRREQAFEREWDRRPASNWKWWELTRDTARQVLGFRIGEAPVNPFASPPIAAAAAAVTAPATGPP